ncbi:HAD family hydrolase [Aliiglaciecola aliphaticivorans]
MVDLSQYKGIVFDMDGTIIDSMGTHATAWQKTCEIFDIPCDGDFIYSLGGVPTREIVKILNEKYGLDRDLDQVAQKKREIWLGLDEALTVIDDTFQIMQRYEGKLKMGVGTGADRDNALRMLSETGLLDRLETVVTSSDVTHGKPHGETFLTAAKNMGLAANECVVFEDTKIGKQAAEHAGMDCIMVINGKVQHP